MVKEFSFLQTLDLFFKMFKIFFVKCHTHVVSLMTFFGKFIYETEETGVLYGRVLEMKNLIFHENDIDN